MTLSLDFKDPLSKSVDSIDWLIVTVLDRELFISAKGIVIASKYKMESKIPKQMKS